MSQQSTPDLKQGLERFKQFRSGPTGERMFYYPTCHPSQPTGFCPCDQAWPATLWFYFKSTLLLTALKLPFNTLKIVLLRRLGARVGRNVFISTDVWIDPTFPELLMIEDDVMVGVGARFFLHLFNRDYFEAGRVTLRKGAVIGASALIGPGVEIGSGAVVALGAVVRRDVPAGKAAIGNPARITPLGSSRTVETQRHE
jgi:acetyltransferase-like isoleucine patch superfamily enzyme